MIMIELLQINQMNQILILNNLYRDGMPLNQPNFYKSIKFWLWITHIEMGCH